MGLIDIFRNGFVTFRNVTQHSVTLYYALYWLQLAHTVGECILQLGSDTLFPNDFGEDLFALLYLSGSLRRKITRTVPCCVMHDSCMQWCTHANISSSYSCHFFFCFMSAKVSVCSLCCSFF